MKVEQQAAHLRDIHAALRSIQSKLSDQAIISDLNDVVHRVGELRLAIDTPDHDERRQHVRVTESIVTAICVDAVEFDAVISDLSIGGVGLDVDRPLKVGTTIEVAVPPLGWVLAEVVGAKDNHLNIRFVEDDEKQKQALLDMIMHYYD